MPRIKNWDHVKGKKWFEQNSWRNRVTGDEVYVTECCGMPNPCWCLEAGSQYVKNIKTFKLAKEKASTYMKKHTN